MEPRWAKGFSLSEALDMIWGDDEFQHTVDQIFVEPPEPNIETDEDSADEDDGGMIHNLNGRQLRAPSEIKLLNNDRLDSAVEKTAENVYYE
ncbi:uncharacterized protein isoform X5 [Leptinotarsa decemlineata]|uniref:uncharacterized protein isoform X5 n=1 Tax=Leptinotarsa decemlineata TaxID=7539 RepID=UPI003D30BD7B